MVEIVRDQVVYNAGSHLELACVYRNTTKARKKKNNGKKSMAESVEDILRRIEAARFRPAEAALPEDTVVWLHDGKRFSHRNRRRSVWEGFSPWGKKWPLDPPN